MFPPFFPHFSILGVTPSPVYGLAMFGQSSLPHQLPYLVFPKIFSYSPLLLRYFCFPLTPFVPLNPDRVYFFLFFRYLFVIVLCIILFTFLSLVGMMD